MAAGFCNWGQGLDGCSRIKAGGCMAADEAGMGAHIRFYDGGKGAGFTAHEARPGAARLLTRQGWGHTLGFARGLHRGDASAKGNRKCNLQIKRRGQGDGRKQGGCKGW